MSYKVFHGVVEQVLKDRGVSPDIINQCCQILPNVPCIDQYVGRVHSWQSWMEDFQIRRPVVKCESDRCVVFVLESPNSAEYSRDKSGAWVSNGPAYGCTGCRMRRYWDTVCKEKFKGYDLILSNVVQYQCSLSSVKDEISAIRPIMMLKNPIFRHCVDDETLWSNFAKRLTDISLLYDGNVDYVCACTLGVGEKSLKRIRSLVKNLRPENVYKTTHPSSWQWKRCRHLEEDP